MCGAGSRTDRRRIRFADRCSSVYLLGVLSMLWCTFARSFTCRVVITDSSYDHSVFVDSLFSRPHYGIIAKMMRQVSNLHIADNDFFEEYKRLDKLCSEMYSCQNGVSEYIAHMERESYQGSYRVSPWNNDYKMLKHVRWVRNQIAHDSGSYQISEPEDLDFVHDFHSRIYSGSDPLTLLRKAIESENTVWKQQKKQASENRIQRPPVRQYTYQAPPDLPQYTPEKKKSRAWIGVLIGVGIIALLLLILYYNR